MGEWLMIKAKKSLSATRKKFYPNRSTTAQSWRASINSFPASSTTFFSNKIRNVTCYSKESMKFKFRKNCQKNKLCPENQLREDLVKPQSFSDIKNYLLLSIVK